MNIADAEKIIKIFKENPIKAVLIAVTFCVVLIPLTYMKTYITKKAEKDARKTHFQVIPITKEFDLEYLKDNRGTQTKPVEINQQPIVIKWQEGGEMTFSLYKLGSEKVFFNDRKQGSPLEFTHLHSGIYKLLCKSNTTSEHFNVFFQVK